MTEGRDLSNRLSAAVDKANAATVRLDQARQAWRVPRRPWLPITTRRSMRRLRATAGNLAMLPRLRQDIVLAEQQLASANAVLDGGVMRRR